MIFVLIKDSEVGSDAGCIPCYLFINLFFCRDELSSKCIQIYKWEDEEEFRNLLFDILDKELGLKNDGDFKDYIHSFNNTLGAVNGSFNVGSAEKVEAWQILSPIRNRAHGVTEINREIHQKFKGGFIRSSKSFKNKFTKAQPAGLEEIVWGDKVINVRNQHLESWNTETRETEEGYLANGEIGLLVQTTRMDKSFALKFEFSTQQGYTYSFYNSLHPIKPKYRFKKVEEEPPAIELAYALTVHKAQGSEFDKVFLVIPRNSFNLSRELIYTALTRQKEGIVILYQGDPVDLMKYSDEIWSETNQRFTNLFHAPDPKPVKDKKRTFLENRLINRTLRGEDVRSKSELIIANILYHYKIDYEYEGILKFNKDIRRPDFIIEDDDTGEIYYWEHLGMMNKVGYRKDWQKKREWYHKNGITEEGGPNGTLIITEDKFKQGIKMGSISSPEIEATLRKYSLIE